MSQSLNQASPVMAGEALTVGYHQPHRKTLPILHNLNLQLYAGELVCLLGPNGAGKSTLMRTLAGMQPALNGRVLLGGTEIGKQSKSEMARRLSVVLTDRLQVGNLTIYELVSLGRFPYTGLLGRLTPRDHAAVSWALDVTHLTALAQRFVHELSDGQRQRVLIARGLAQEPEFMLLDEPTAFLDLPTRVETTTLLRRLARETGLAVLLSTHDLDLAMRLADKLWLVGPEGVHCGAPEDLAVSGVFARVFATDDLEFDAVSGSFRQRTQSGQIVIVRGEGLHTMWLHRALEREGYTVQRNGMTGVVTWYESGQALPWRVREQAHERGFDTIADLLAYLRVASFRSIRAS